MKTQELLDTGWNTKHGEIEIAWKKGKNDTAITELIREYQRKWYECSLVDGYMRHVCREVYYFGIFRIIIFIHIRDVSFLHISLMKTFI